MSSPKQHRSSVKRNRRIIYSSDADDSDGPERTRPKLGNMPPRAFVSEGKEDYIVTPIYISSRSVNPLNDLDDGRGGPGLAELRFARVHSPSKVSNEDLFDDDERFSIPSISLSSRSASPVDSSSDAPGDSLVNLKLGTKSSPIEISDDDESLPQAAGIPYSDVDLSDFDSDNEHDRNYWGTADREAHDNASWTSEVSTINSEGDEEIAVDDAYIDHDSADLEITARELHDLVSSPGFDFAAAKKLVHTNYSFDWEAESLEFEKCPRIGIRDADEAYDKWAIEHFFDYTSVEGSPLQAVSVSKSRLDTVRFSFDEWYQPYRNKLSAVAQSGQEFKTFHFAAAGRLQYYMIFRCPMEPLVRQPRSKCRPLRYTSLIKERALELSAFMIDIFSSVRELKACGINKETWSGLRKNSHDLDHKSFEIFQIEFFARWKDEFVAGHQTQGWTSMIPEIHIYSYGTNQALSYNSRNPRESLDAITEDLKRQYDPSSIRTLSFAIATQVSLIQVDPRDDHVHGRGKYYPRALLASTEEVYNQYNSQKPSHSCLRTFPLLLSPKVCNFQSATLPKFYNDLVHCIVTQVKVDNNEINSVEPPLDFVSFQGYSFLQKQVHADFRIGETNYAGAHCISEQNVQGVNLTKLRKLREGTSIHRPIAIVNEGLAVLGSGDPIPFRFEPVVSISLCSLKKSNRTFEYIVANIIRPLLDIWHRNHLYICTQILLPFDVSVSPFSDFSVTYTQTFLGVAADFTKLSHTLLQGIIEIDLPPQNDIRYLGYTESISILERVIVWILTGDLSIQPKRLYRVIGLLSNSLRRGWPGINQDILDLDTFHVKVTSWPMNGEEPYFSQIAALKHHFGVYTANAQQITLACLVLPAKDTSTHDGCSQALRNIFKNCFMPELQQFWINKLQKYKRDILKQSDIPISWDRETREVLDALRAEHPFSPW
jgi:hypothetical protein